MATIHTGSCLCQGVRFTIEGELPPIQICHCSICRRAQGGPFATNIPIKTSALTLHNGQALIKRFESSPGKMRAFCSACGSPLFSENRAMPDLVRIRAGLLAEPVNTVVGLQIYADSKAGWWPPDDGLPAFAEGIR